MRAHQRGASSVQEQLEVVEERFLEDRIVLDRPYLNPESPDLRFSIGSFGERRPRRVAASPRFDARACLAAADVVGHDLCRDALWHRDVCNWVGGVPDPGADAEHAYPPECRTLGPDLYAGTSGIALFLAQLHAVAPSAELRRTALGALRHAFLRTHAVTPDLRLGLYTGWSGIVLAVLRAGKLLRHDETLTQARELACCLARRTAPGFDLLSGKAGAIVSLVLLWRELRCPELLDAAVRLGRQLLRHARKTVAGYSWTSVNVPHRRNLTGLSHGAAGIGVALLELAAAADREEFRHAAIRAFDYERHYFDPHVRTWPDFRQPSPARRPVFASAWCNGAPGIALSRLRAWQILQDPLCRDETVIALETTRAIVRAGLDGRMLGYCLCHGLAGNADVLLEAPAILGSGHNSLIFEVASRASLPQGVPGLMIGHAGLGYFYLRAASLGAVPSALLITTNWLRA